MPLAADLERIEGWLASKLPTAHAALRPGLDAAGIANLAMVVGGTLGDELGVLLAWHAGQTAAKPAVPTLADDDEVYELMTEDEIAAQWHELGTRLDKGKFDAPTYTTVNAWHRTWIPFARMKTVLLVVDVGRTLGGDVRQVIRVPLRDGDRIIVAPSLASYIASYARALDEGGVVAAKGKLTVKRWPTDPDAKRYPIRKRVERIARLVETPTTKALLNVVSQRMSASEITAAIAAGADLAARDGNGFTPLHLAAQGPTSIAAETLLAAGAEVDARDASGRTPLTYAVEHTKVPVGVAIVTALVRAGANPDAADRDGSTPRTRAEKHWNPDAQTQMTEALDG